MQASSTLSFEIKAKRSTPADEIPQSTIEQCIQIVTEAMRGCRDRDGNALVLHSLMVGSMGETDAEKCVGYLHDLIEDTPWTLQDLRNYGLPESILEALDLCTHPEGMNYDDYIQRIIDSRNITALRVKRNDLRHNLARGHAFNYPRLIAKHTAALLKIDAALNASCQ